MKTAIMIRNFGHPALSAFCTDMGEQLNLEISPGYMMETIRKDVPVLKEHLKTFDFIILVLNGHEDTCDTVETALALYELSRERPWLMTVSTTREDRITLIGIR